MRRMVILGLALALTLAACGSSGEKAAVDPAVQRDADLYQIDQIERTWHKASSKHDVDLMMTLWAPDATFTIGTGGVELATNRTRWSTVIGRYLYPCWSDHEGHGYLSTDIRPGEAGRVRAGCPRVQVMPKCV